MKRRRLPLIYVALPSHVEHALKKVGLPRVDARIYRFDQLPATTPDALIVCQMFFGEQEGPHFARVKVIMKALAEKGGLIISWGCPAESTQEIDDDKTEEAYSRGTLTEGYEEALRVHLPSLPVSLPMDAIEPACFLSVKQLKSASSMRQFSSRGIDAHFAFPSAGKKLPFPVETLIADKDSGQAYAARIKYGEANIVVLPCSKLPVEEIVQRLVGYAENHAQPLPDNTAPGKAILIMYDDAAVFMGRKLKLKGTALDVLRYYANRAGKSLNNEVVVRACSKRDGASAASVRNHLKDIRAAVEKAARNVLPPSARPTARKIAKAFIAIPRYNHSRLELTQDKVALMPGKAP